MRCAKARTMINLELDGALPPEQTPALEAHLIDCAECRAHRSDLAVGQRLLKATASEPSAAFEWKLQLRLNQALQEKAAVGLPWETQSASSWFRWLRTFSLSSAAGLALSLLVAFWLLPARTGVVTTSPSARSTASPKIALADAGSSPARAVTASAGNLDRRPLSGYGVALPFKRGNGFGHAVDVSGASFLSDQPVRLNFEGSQGRSLTILQNEVGRLRARLLRSEKENEELKALLDQQGIGYSGPRSEGQPK